VGEFPIIYYAVAKIWKITGPQEWIFRLVQTLILFVGLWCLFQVLHGLFRNWFWAGFTSLLLFTAPMLVFYGPNFFPDGPSLGLFSLPGIYYAILLKSGVWVPLAFGPVFWFVHVVENNFGAFVYCFWRLDCL
jgi:hypothetical protein